MKTNVYTKIINFFKLKTGKVHNETNLDGDFLNYIMKHTVTEMPVNDYSTEIKSPSNIILSNINRLDGYSYVKEKTGRVNIFYNQIKIGYINGQISSLNSVAGINITKDKIKTEKYLKKNNITTTKSVLFKEDAYDFAKVFVEHRNEPLVLKPNNLSGGRGVSINVGISNFDNTWKLAVQACKEQKKEVNILLQNKIEGIESRFLVINNKFYSAILRIPANVIGDGINTIEELINIKNINREKNPYLKRLLIKKDDQTIIVLEAAGKSLKSIPEKNEVIFLRLSSNLTQGGDNVEISHLVNDKMIEIAEESVRAIPGLLCAGVDILFTSFEDSNPHVLEINPSANFRMHHYPWKGVQKNPTETLITSMKELNF